MKHTPLDDQEMFSLIELAYPEKFSVIEDDDKAFQAVQEFISELNSWDKVADLLGRMVMLSPVMSSPGDGLPIHILGGAKINGDEVLFQVAVQRDAELSDDH